MKINRLLRLLILSCFMISAESVAETEDEESSSSYEENRLDSLHYRPLTHDWIWGIESSFQQKDSSFAPQGKYLLDSFSSTMEILYGVSERISVGLAENYLFSGSSTKVSNGSVMRLSGPSDPRFFFNYRYAGSVVGNFFADGILVVSPGVGDRKIADSLQVGNNFNGYTSFTLGTELNWVLFFGELGLAGKININSPGTFKASTSASSYTSSGDLNGSIEGVYRVHFFDHFYASLMAKLNFRHDVIYTFSNSYLILSYPWYLSPALDFGYRVSPHVVAYIRYRYDGYLAEGGTFGEASAYSTAQNFITLGFFGEF